MQEKIQQPRKQMFPIKKFVNWSKNKAKKAAKSLKKKYGNVVQKGKIVYQMLARK